MVVVARVRTVASEICMLEIVGVEIHEITVIGCSAVKDKSVMTK